MVVTKFNNTIENKIYETENRKWKTVIYDMVSKEYLYGCSAKVKVPDEIIANTNKSQRLSDVVAKFVGKTDDEVSKIGTNGLLTNGSYTRTDEFTDSIVCAISTKYKKLI